MASDDLSVVGDQDRICKAKSLNRGGDLFDLCLAVTPGVARIWLQG
jgi:hypothetical protein